MNSKWFYEFSSKWNSTPQGVWMDGDPCFKILLPISSKNDIWKWKPFLIQTQIVSMDIYLLMPSFQACFPNLWKKKSSMQIFNYNCSKRESCHLGLLTSCKGIRHKCCNRLAKLAWCRHCASCFRSYRNSLTRQYSRFNFLCWSWWRCRCDIWRLAVHSWWL